MQICLFLGIMFVIFGILYLFRQHSSDETQIVIKDVKIVGNPGSLLIIFGFILIIVGSGLIDTIYNREDTTNQQDTGSVTFQQITYRDATLYSKPGMAIDIILNTQNLQDENCAATAYFYTSNNEPIKTSSLEYSTTDGSLASSYYFTPNSKNTDESMSIFIPFEEFYMETGTTYELKYEVLIWHGNTILARSGLQPFTVYN